MASGVEAYLGLCLKYGTRPNADVAIWLRLLGTDVRSGRAHSMASSLEIHAHSHHQDETQVYQDRLCTHHLDQPGALVIRSQPPGALAGPFTDLDMLPLVDLLVDAHPQALAALLALDLSRCHLGRAGVHLLCRRVLRAPLCRLAFLDLSGQSLGHTGALSISSALQANRSLVALVLHNCWLRRKGGETLARMLAARPRQHSLLFLDCSNNIIPFETCVPIEANAIPTPGKGAEAFGSAAPADLHCACTVINTSGNRVFDEVLNAVSHGLAFVLSIVGACFMGSAVVGQPSRYAWSVTLYLISLCSLFLASTLYHSFFTLRNTRVIFSVIDHSAIYLLISGSYTPILAIVFPDLPSHSTYMLGAMWAMCAVGLLVTAFMRAGSMKSTLSLSLYLGMGWVALFIGGDIVERIGWEAMWILIGGGAFFTLGVPFFIKNGQTWGMPDHTIWHIFVLLGALTHFFSIYSYVLPVVLSPAVLAAAGDPGGGGALHVLHQDL